MPKMGKIPPEWWLQQQSLAAAVVHQPIRQIPRMVAGADIAFSPDGNHAVAVAIVWDRVAAKVVEVQVARQPVKYPYVPGFLSFREGPVLTDAIAKLTTPWEIICFDGQGIAHPRRCGMAAHMGVTLNRPAIGVAKSRLCGDFTEPASAAGSYSKLMDGKDQIGIVLRTRTGVKPIYVSVGHLVDLPSARRIVLACCTRYRIPEPTRQADILTHVYRSRPA